MSWRAAMIAVLLAAAIASGWSAWKQRAEVAGATATSDRSDYVLEDFQLVSLDSGGQEAFTLRAPHLHRDPVDGTMSLREPLFLLPEEEDGLYWDLRAATGWISADSEEMRLRGDVVVVSDPAGARGMRMETGALDVFPEQRVARSDDAVTITQPGTTMRGTGMEADLAEKRFRLTSKVQTRYVPTRR
ncbi:LPS export ABC transporter periplasmic protein LptC [Luteimonas sp. MJ246]|uniref:LPS export ABC transporter periplasmic protein LptC n=1 Tax=Luteimonas sp. MJ174 TaxID=3129237 RepID=UPI0031BA764B